jgi:DNA mismatch repair protein MSH6
LVWRDVLAAAMDEFEKTPVSSKTTKKAPLSTSRLPAKAGESSRASQFTYEPSSSSTNTQKTPTRPPVRPLGNGSNKSAGKRSGLNSAGGGSGGFITQAERSRLEAKEKKRAEEDCFEFLKDLRDVSHDIINSLTIIGVYDPTLMRDGMHCSWYTL